LPAIGQQAAVYLWPRFLHHRWEVAFIHTPLSYLVDGYAAVSIFFLISGTVLTYSFAAAPLNILRNGLRRIVRLGLPLAAAVMLAACLFGLIPAAHIAAGEESRSVYWLKTIGPEEISWHAVLQNIFMGLSFGYSDMTLLPAGLSTALKLTASTRALNPPLWTIHFELYGSLLVLLLVGIRASYGRAVHTVGCLTTLAIFLWHPLGLFVIGHMLSSLLISERWQRATRFWLVRLLAPAFLLLGFCFSSHHLSWAEPPMEFMNNAMRMPGSVDGPYAYSYCSALLLFLGFVGLPRLWLLLASRPCLWLGRLSYSLYLVHFPILFTVASLVYTISRSAALAALIGIPLSFAVAVGFELLIDRPAISLSRKVGKASAGP
jgi:peptidoglycan/LPS O-acetylase OafA/YrhL